MKFENECWDHFKGETWKREINVREFIQSNYTPYEGDDSFLVVSSEKTRKVWNKLTEIVEEYKKAHNGQSVYSATFIEDCEPAVKKLQEEYGFNYTIQEIK